MSSAFNVCHCFPVCNQKGRVYWRENAIAHCHFSTSFSENVAVNWREQLSNFKSLIILRPEKGQPFSNKFNRAKLSGDKKYNVMKLWIFFDNTRTNLCWVKSPTRSRPRSQI